MTSDDADGSEPATDGEERTTTRFGRRSMLAVLGAGSTVGLASQYGSVRGQEGGGEGDGGGAGDGGDGGDGGGTTQGRCPPCIDAYTGYLQAAGTTDGEGQPGNISPVATVELRVSDADVVFVEEGGGGQATGTASTPMGTPTGTPDETPTGTPEETPAETGTPGTGTPGAGDGGAQGFPDFYFDPVGIAIQPGDAVEFRIREELHTVTAYHPRYFGFQQRVPEGTPGFSSPPVVPDDSWYYRFDEPGVYDLLCLPHEGFGMVMRVVVTEEGTDEVPEAYAEPAPEQTGPSPIALRVLNASELDPANVVEQGTVAWTDLTGVESDPPFGG